MCVPSNFLFTMGAFMRVMNLAGLKTTNVDILFSTVLYEYE